MIKVGDRVRSRFTSKDFRHLVGLEGDVTEVDVVDKGEACVTVVTDFGQEVYFMDYQLDVIEPKIHLWEVEHPGEFEARGGELFSSWKEFLNYEMHVMSDGGSSLLIAWEWSLADESSGVPEVLNLYFIFPLDGFFSHTTVEVSATDESDVRAWLAKHAEVAAKMWAPFKL